MRPAAGDGRPRRRCRGPCPARRARDPGARRLRSPTRGYQRGETATARVARVPWSEVFIVFFVSHLVGDFGIQTEWQGAAKARGRRPPPASWRRSTSHTPTSTAAHAPLLLT